ncbi:MAG TPA: SDR family oxidoreductase, partial [Pseudomonadota bacterium]|nr:SDR family oxidoreductase [Pseudomonadota bacterium]
MKLALVTGGTRGIGLAVAHRLAADGYAVTVTYAHDAAQAEHAVSAARSMGLDLSALRCDAASVDDWKTLSQPGGFFDGKSIAVLVHAAGFTRDKLAMTMPVGDFDDVLDVHLRGGFLSAQAVMKGMIAARFGRILFICSPTAWLGRRGQTAYGAAKAGLYGLTKSLVQELSRFQITCNCVSAGLVDTALTADLPEPIRAELLRSIPLGRPGTAQEIAELVAFL